MTLTPEQARVLERQIRVDHLAFPFLAAFVVWWLGWRRRYRLAGLDEVRRVFDEAVGRKRPMVICANHLTMIDSLVLHRAMSTIPRMMLDFRRFSWNVPAIENFAKNFGLRVATYLGKTIPIDRMGSAEHRREVVEKLAWLVEHGEICTIFPEGGRSRTGRVEPESVTYGVGQILKDLKDPLVVCVYLRGDQQETWSDVPVKGDTIRVEATVLEPRTTETGMRAARDLSRQVILELKRLEDGYFARRSAQGREGPH